MPTKFCYFTAARSEQERRSASTLIQSARKAGVVEDFHLFSLTPVDGFENHTSLNSVRGMAERLEFLKYFGSSSYEFCVWMDSANYFVRNPGNFASQLRGNKCFVPLEGELTSSSIQSPDGFVSLMDRMPSLVNIMRSFGCGDRVWAASGGFWIVRREAIGEFVGRVEQVLDELHKFDERLVEQQSIAIAGQTLVSDPKNNTVEVQRLIWARDWAGSFVGTLPDGDPWIYRDWVTGHEFDLNPAIVHAVRATEVPSSQDRVPRPNVASSAKTAVDPEPSTDWTSPLVPPSKENPRYAFDRVVVINVERRLDRRAEMMEEFKKADWPFVQPIFMKAIDGERVEPPKGYGPGRNVWACLQSHRRAIEDALNDGVKSLLVLEDDAKLAADFRERALKFMSEIPDDWELLFMGGHHYRKQPIYVKDGIVRTQHHDRMHCYGARGAGLLKLYRHWHQWFDGHCDHAISLWVPKQRHYCVQPWLVGQRASPSDIVRMGNVDGQQVPKKESWFHSPTNTVAQHPDEKIQTIHIDRTATLLNILKCPHRGPIVEERGNGNRKAPSFPCNHETHNGAMATLWTYDINQAEPACDRCPLRPRTPMVMSVRPVTPVIPLTKPPKPEAVGTELARLLAQIGVVADQCTECKAMIHRMNEWGVKGCNVEKNRNAILHRLRDRCRQAHWIDKIKYGFGTVWSGLVMKVSATDPAPGLLDEAIRICSIKPERPLLSACMPTRGRPEMAQRSIESFYETTTKFNREFIVVTHPDQSVPVLRKMEEQQDRFPGLKVVEADCNAIQGWNLALKHSSGQFVKTADDDLVFLPNWFEPVIEKWKEVGEPSVALFGLFDDDSRVPTSLYTRTVGTRRFFIEICGGVLCIPNCGSWYSDNIVYEMAVAAKCNWYVPNSVIQHNQAARGRGPKDGTFWVGNHYRANDRLVYEQSKANGHPITWPPMITS